MPAQRPWPKGNVRRAGGAKAAGPPPRPPTRGPGSGLEPDVAELQVRAVRMDQLVEPADFRLRRDRAVAEPEHDVVGLVLHALLDVPIELHALGWIDRAPRALCQLI